MTTSNGAMATVSLSTADMPDWSDVLPQAPDLNHEAWTQAIRQGMGRYTATVVEPNAFAAKMLMRSVCGIAGVDLAANNAFRIERTRQDARLDGVDDYHLVFQVSGGTAKLDNGHALVVSVGDVALVDSARPLTCINEYQQRQWLMLQLPRRSLVSHLGFEPQYKQRGQHNRRAGRLLFQLIREVMEDEESMSTSACTYTRLAIYDLVGALLSSPDTMSISRHTDRLFTRLCDIVRGRFADPRLDAGEVAAEAGISMRYVQKIFAMRNLTCTQFINSVRLDHSASLLQRRALLERDQPISEIAYASGFGDYSNFARKFRTRFGHAPRCHATGSCADVRLRHRYQMGEDDDG